MSPAHRAWRFIARVPAPAGWWKAASHLPWRLRRLPHAQPPSPPPSPASGRGRKQHAARSSGLTKTKAERSDGPSGLHLPSGRAEKRRAWGGRGSAACRASCSDSLRLFERRERSEQSEFRSAAPRPSIAGCPQRSGGTRPVGSPFLWLLSFGETKESDCAAGRNPGQQRIQPHRHRRPEKNATQRPTLKSPAPPPPPVPRATMRRCISHP